MKKSAGLNKYLYEYLFHQAIDRTRNTNREVLPISQAKAIRRDVEASLSARLAERNAGKDESEQQRFPGLAEFCRETDRAITASVPGSVALFTTPDGGSTGAAPALQQRFMSLIGLSGPGGPGLPISPYDPEWSERGAVKSAGTQLLYIDDEDINTLAGGSVEQVSPPAAGMARLWTMDDERGRNEAGIAMSDEDAAGLTALREKMSIKEYNQVAQWVLDGGRDPRTGQIDRNRFMTPAATARSVALLSELQAQGLDYEISRDTNPGQIKARIAGTTMEIRLTDRRDKDDYVGRIYDNGVITRYSVKYDRHAVYSASPEEAVALLHFAQGRAVEREDVPGSPVGSLGTHTETQGYGERAHTVQAPDSYYPGRGTKLERNSMFAFKDVPGVEGQKVYMRREAANRTLPEMFVRTDAAENYLREAVDSARANMGSALAVEDLISSYEAQRNEAEISADGVSMENLVMPELSSNEEIAAIQRSYWDVLTGRHRELLRPGATQEMYDDRLGEIGELAAGEEPDMGNLVYGGSPAEKIRAHAQDVVEEQVGSYDPIPVYVDDTLSERRFDPLRVARYMTSEKGQFSNLDDLAAACRKTGIRADEMLGNGPQSSRFKDRLITFDETTAVDVSEHTSPFIRQIGQVVRDSISRSGAEPAASTLIDENGVIRWSAEKIGRDGQRVPVSGTIGQVFDPGEYGEIVTSFASGENALVVPGYEARIAAQRPGENKSVEERTLLRGYEQAMSERIQYQMAGDLVIGRSEVGDPASLNVVYSQLYGTKHPVDFLDSARRKNNPSVFSQLTEQERQEAWLAGDIKALERDDQIRDAGEVDEWTRTILQTEARRVRYANDIRAGSTIYAEYQAQHSLKDPADDNHFDAWQLTGGRNMAVLTGRDANGAKIPEGYYDPVMTGGAINQGVVRYLTADAQVDPDGHIVPGDPETLTGSRAPLMTREEMATLRYDPFDRQQMTASTIMQSAEVTEPTGTALMTFGGWTADDPIVVSKDFAEGHRIRGAGGQERALVVGDKISDLHGNKGVISLVVDREMSLEQAEEFGIKNEVSWFQANPGMDVAMSPFSLISRRNAGSARELMNGEVDELRAPQVSDQDASTFVHPTAGGVGQMRFVVTHMAVDEKTKIYDEDQVRAGRGRKASSQLAWALQSQQCPAIMSEFYGANTGAEANLREYMISMGLDMEADGTLRVIGRDVDDRGLSHEAIDARPERRLIEMPELVRNARGGLATGSMVSQFGSMIGDRGGDLELPFPLRYPTGERTEQVTANSWKMPVLSSHLRSGQEFDDGTVVAHDYTNRYLEIFREACRYRGWAEQLEDPSLDAAKRTDLTQSMSRAALTAQRKFEAINADLEQRVFSGKKNIFKTGLMSSRLPDSATAVWTADPRLDIDQVAMSPVMAEQLGLAEGEHALVWRDPILRDAGLRYMRVAIDERLTGVAINPVMDACFDGDFDGDAVAVVKLHSQAAKAEALANLSVPANLLDTGVIKDGVHPLAMQQSLDTKVALSKNPELAEEFDSATREANRIALEAKRGADATEIAAAQQDLTAELSDLYRQAQRGEFGSALTFADREAHLRSVKEVCVDTGAKGSEKKLDDYARYLGDEQGRPGITEADQQASMFATAIKAHGTGLGGSYSQRAVRALRNTDLKAVLEVTYPVTQSILQAKHDASEAREKYEALQGPGRDLWRGYKLEHIGPGAWLAEYENGEPVQATAEEWEKQFIDFYSAKDGFNVSVNPEYVGRVAQGLKDPRTGLMRNLEEDISLEGSLMDRMAYGGTFADLVAAADNHENLYDGEKNIQFAPKVTRQARELNEQGLQALDSQEELSAPVIADELIKRDVMADDERRAQVRGSSRRSPQAVGVGAAPKPGSYTPSIDIDAESTETGYGMGE